MTALGFSLAIGPKSKRQLLHEELAQSKVFTGFMVGAFIGLASFELLLECPKQGLRFCLEF